MSNNPEQRETFVIVDANAFVHSSFHGYSPCLDAKGEDQRVLQGIMNTFVDLTRYIPTIDYLYVIFDPSDGSLYRKSLFPAYKANRPPTDPDLARQREVAKKVIEDHLGIPTVSHPGYEADDIIGSLACLAKDQYNVIIISPDKDLAQLVCDNVLLMRKMRTKTERGYKPFNKDKVFEHFGVHPHQIPDWLALVGDAADNLPGLDKVGEKTAANILSTYPSVEHMFAILHEMEDEKLKNKIMGNVDSIKLVKHLATIVCDLPIAEKAHEALAKADRIRSHAEYNKKLLAMRKHFSWPNHFLDMFAQTDD